MRNRMLLVAAMLVLAVTTVGIFATPTAEARPGTDGSMLRNFDDMMPAGGVSLLTRGAGSVSLQINATHLTPGDAVTVWWVIFNNPGECAAACMVNDLFVTAVNGSVMWATGGIVSAGGHITFHATLEEGPTTADQPFSLLADPLGLQDASAAEIHVVVRTHGVALTGPALETQLTTFEPLCVVVCADLQFAVHLP